MKKPDHLNLRISHCGDVWHGYIENQLVATFEYQQEEDSDDVWLSSAEVKKEYQKQGIGRRMIEAAVEQYGLVYASSAPGGNEVFDTRYLSEEGARLISACIRDGIMDRSWWRNPGEPDIEDAE